MLTLPQIVEWLVGRIDPLALGRHVFRNHVSVHIFTCDGF
jgi:hypothetical protein